MANTICFSGPAFSIVGELLLTTTDVDFQVSFNSLADQSTVKTYQWYLDGELMLGQSLQVFQGKVLCGNHTIGARILTADGWSGIKSVSFQTCIIPDSIVIVGPDTVIEGVAVNYQVIKTLADQSTQDVTSEYTLTCPDGTFSGGAFTPSVEHQASHQSTITASKAGADPITKSITITGTPLTPGAGILVVDFYNDISLNIIGFVDNAEVANNHQPAYKGNNIIPSGSTPAAALILASDLVQQVGSSLTWRFEFNIAKLLTGYPATTQFIFYIKGRGATAGTLSGAYVLKTYTSEMTLVGTANNYIPSVNGNNFGSSYGFNVPLTAGANGSYAEADLPVLMKFTYDVNSQSISYGTP